MTDAAPDRMQFCSSRMERPTRSTRFPNTYATSPADALSPNRC